MDSANFSKVLNFGKVGPPPFFLLSSLNIAKPALPNCGLELNLIAPPACRTGKDIERRVAARTQIFTTDV